MCFWYAASSIRPPSSLRSAIFSLKNQALSAASELTSAGSLARSALTSSTSPEVGSGLHRFDDGGGFRLLQGASDFRQFDEHDVAELRLRVIRHPDGGDVAFDAEPFVVGGVKRRHAKSSAFIGVGNKRHWSCAHRQTLTAHFGVDELIGSSVRRRQISHRDRRIEAHAEATGGDDADRLG
jgi:hypothetical protein